MTETIGTARLDIVVDTSQFDAAITSAKRSVSGMSSAAQAEYNKLNGAEKRRVDSLIKQADTIGFTREQQILYNAALKGTPTHIIDELKTKLAGTAQATTALATASKTVGKELNAAGISAKQMNFALRGVPAQFTDIATSLASGQKPLLVLLQQGGQLKDMFGGVGPAVRALGGYIAGLVNPITIAVAAVAAFGFVWNKAQNEVEAFNKAIILTGNFAQVSAAELADMAQTLDRNTAVTAGKASDILAQVAATGRFTAEQIGLVSEAAAQMEDATGKAIEETIKEFASLKGDPVDAILKLNEAQHFLTEETFKQIESLKKQGREVEAADVAIRAYADTINTRAPEIIESLGLFESLWREIKEGSKGAFDGIVQGFRDADIEAKQAIKTHQQYLAAAGFGGFLLRSVLPPPPSLRGQASGQKPAVNSDQARASLEFEKEAVRFATDKQRMEKDITAARALGLKAGKSELEIEQRISAIRASYKRKEPKGPNTARGIEGATNRAALQGIKDQLKVEQGAIANSTQLLAAQYSARLITAKDYYAELKKLTQAGADAEEKSLLGQIDVLQARKVSGKDNIDTVNELAQLEADLAKLRADSSTKLTVLNIQEADSFKQRKLAAEAYKAALDESAVALQAQLDNMVARVGMGEREFEIQSQINELYRDQAKELLELARQRDAGQIDQETYDAREDALRNSIEAEVNIVRDGYERMAEAQSDWKNGAVKAYEDYIDKVSDVAGQTRDLFSNTFDGLANAAADFATGTKDAFGSLLDDILKQSIRFLANQAIKQLMLALGGGGGGVAGGEGGGESWGSLVDLFSGDWGFKKGGAFAGGVQAFANGGAFTNQIVTQPTNFRFAKGIGLMGEAGPEAIMPLKRGRDGRLGVEAAATVGSEGGRPVINNNTTFVVPSHFTRQTQGQIAVRNQQVQSSSYARNV